MYKVISSIKPKKLEMSVFNLLQDNPEYLPVGSIAIRSTGKTFPSINNGFTEVEYYQAVYKQEIIPNNVTQVFNKSCVIKK